MKMSKPQTDRINLCPKCYPEKKSFLSYNPKKRGVVICPIHGEMQWPIEDPKGG